MWKNLQYAVLILGMSANSVVAQDKSFTLAAPDILIGTGFLKHLLPRFSLKTQIRIVLAESGDAAFGETGTPVFRHGDVTWHLSENDDEDVERFRDWLTSEIGKRTVEAFDGFSADVAQKTATVEVTVTGDALLGEKVSLKQCGRCHVVSDKNRMNGIGSSPSFRLMRTFSDWRDRFEGFYLLKPHPAFTQIEDVTDPFPIGRPSPIAPIEVTLDELEAIVAYVDSLPPANLGAAIKTLRE
ncbi:MAG: hypothetical protein ABJ327_19485 [Litoreibacter sp.]